MVGQKGGTGMTRKLLGMLLLIGLLITCGCGGGGDTVVNVGGSQPTKAVISFSLISTATLPFRLNGVRISATLPTGFTVATAGSAITSGLEAGSATINVVNTNLFPIFGSYSAPNRVTLIIADSTNAQVGFGPGEMVRLTGSLVVGTTVTESDRLALENAITFNASGWDPRPTATTNPSSLNLLLKPRVTVTLVK